MSKSVYVHNESIHTEDSPNEIVPALVQLFQPRSVIDVGCGTGNFLKVFKHLGVKEVLGIDGDWVDRNVLSENIDPATEFLVADLHKPLSFQRRFDLVVSLEVAEHLSATAAESFIHNLTSLGDAIVFSAAIPNQGGQNHINEQPVSYWEALFAKKGFVLRDILRPYFWDNKKVFSWYKQNITLYLHKDYKLLGLPEHYSDKKIRDIVHPELFNLKSQQLDRILHGQYPMTGYFKLLLKGVLNKVGIKKFDKR
jgi:SAM-dependent methyltransferase